MTLEATVAGDAQEAQQQEGAEFVVVVDRSGSMQGTPWRQVELQTRLNKGSQRFKTSKYRRKIVRPMQRSFIRDGWAG